VYVQAKTCKTKCKRMSLSKPKMLAFIQAKKIQTKYLSKIFASI